MPTGWYILLTFSGGMTVVNDDKFQFISNSAVVSGADSRGVLLNFNGASFTIFNLLAANAGD